MIQVVILLLIYFVVRTWMQRDLASGMAPVINSRDMAGEIVSLSDYPHGPVLIHFWATWCPVCEFEQDAISSIAKDWPVLSIAMQSGSDNEVEAFMNKNGLDWRTIVDEAGLLSTQYGVTGVPVSFVVDSDGNIDFKEIGYTTSWGLRLRLWLSKLFS